MASKRATSDILQEIEAVLESFLKRDSIEATAPNHTGEHSRRTTTPKIAGSEVSNISSWLKNLGNIFSIGTGGLAIAGAVDGSFSSNSTKREIEQAYNGIDLAALLDGATPQFNDRRSTTPKISSSEVSVPKVSSSEVSSLESGLSKLAGVFSVGVTVASLVSGFDGSSNSSGISIKRSENGAVGLDSSDSFILSVEEKRSITSDILGELVSLLGGVIGESDSGSGISIKRSDDGAVGLDASEPFTLSAEKRSITSDILEELLSLFGGAIGGSGSSNAISIKRSANNNDTAAMNTLLALPQFQRILAELQLQSESIGPAVA